MDLVTWLLASNIFGSFHDFIHYVLTCKYVTTAVICSIDEKLTECTNTILIYQCIEFRTCRNANTELYSGCFFPRTLFSMFSYRLATLCRPMQQVKLGISHNLGVRRFI